MLDNDHFTGVNLYHISKSLRKEGRNKEKTHKFGLYLIKTGLEDRTLLVELGFDRSLARDTAPSTFSEKNSFPF